MARKRMLSPEFFTDAAVNRLPIPAMMTWLGLRCYADDYGRAEDDAALVKAAVWPRRREHTERRVTADLSAIERLGMICRYEVEDRPLLHIIGWSSLDEEVRQRIDHPTASRLAPCPRHEPLLHDVWRDNDREKREGLANGSRADRERFSSSLSELNSREGSSSGAPAAEGRGRQILSDNGLTAARRGSRLDESGAATMLREASA